MKIRITSLLLAAGLLGILVLPVLASAPEHGTSGEWIGEEMLDTQVPESYVTDSATQAKARAGLYNSYFLKDRLQTVSIQIDENNLNYLLQNALEEPYVLARSVTVGDVTQGYCGLRTKGNFTLQHSYTGNPGSDRFSFTVHFGKYVQGQNFFGCKKISFNNFFFDKSMLKEFFSLMLMEQMGLPTPQFGLAKLYINGAYYGVYFIVEAMDESILEQYFGVDQDRLSSYLCKPTLTRFRYQDLKKDPSPLYEYDEDTRQKVEDMLPTALEWARKLDCLAQGQDFSGNPLDVQSDAYVDLLGQVMDVDEVLRYFAVHSWLCQMDNMFVEQQNFGLYLSPEGICTLIPWDYDLAFGCYYPSTAETTANYPLPVMYKLNFQMWDTEPEQSKRYYQNFPLFYVLYQNDALMDTFRSYMLDCSKISVLGGCVETTGKTYDPAWFTGLIQALEVPLLEAAEEALAPNVYYMNHTHQPQDVKKAIPNLVRILAMRAVGVYNQVTGRDAWVCGSGCNLETLGNASWSESRSQGRLSLVDPYTGIFTEAEYVSQNRSPAPVLNVTGLTEDSPIFQQVKARLQPKAGDQLTVYQLRSAVKPTGGYTVTIPLPAKYASAEAQNRFYLLIGSALTPLETTQEDNLFSCEMAQLGTVVILTRLPVVSRIADYIPLILVSLACVLTLTGIAIHTRIQKSHSE